MTTAIAKRTVIQQIPAWAHELGVPRIEDYFGAWAFEEQRFSRIVDSVRGMDIAAHVARNQETQAALPVRTPAEIVQASTDQDGICTIVLVGSLMKQVGSLTHGTSTIRARQLLRACGVDSGVRGVMLRIDSPGGTVSGTGDLADDVAALAAKKPVFAFIEDLCASAAYWVASAATRVMANASSLVGCIGTYSVICDYSAAATLEGVKVHVIRAGEMKGAGVPGTEITPAILGEAQRIVNSLNQVFLGGVAKGRRMTAEKVSGLADGRVWIAAEAVEKGLIDAIGSIDQVGAAILTMVDKAGGNRRKEKARMSQEHDDGAPAAPPAPKAASFAELKKAFPKADAAFRESCMERGLTLEDARGAWQEKLENDLEASRKETSDAKAAAASGKPGGTKPILPKGRNASGAAAGDDDDDTEAEASQWDDAGGPIAAWESAVGAQMKRNGGNKAKAVSHVVHHNKELHDAYIEECNKPENLPERVKQERKRRR